MPLHMHINTIKKQDKLCAFLAQWVTHSKFLMKSNLHYYVLKIWCTHQGCLLVGKKYQGMYVYVSEITYVPMKELMQKYNRHMFWITGLWNVDTVFSDFTFTVNIVLSL